jgi:hypothetical protein
MELEKIQENEMKKNKKVISKNNNNENIKAKIFTLDVFIEKNINEKNIEKYINIFESSKENQNKVYNILENSIIEVSKIDSSIIKKTILKEKILKIVTDELIKKIKNETYDQELENKLKNINI